MHTWSLKESANRRPIAVQRRTIQQGTRWRVNSNGLSKRYYEWDEFGITFLTQPFHEQRKLDGNERVALGCKPILSSGLGNSAKQTGLSGNGPTSLVAPALPHFCVKNGQETKSHWPRTAIWDMILICGDTSCACFKSGPTRRLWTVSAPFNALYGPFCCHPSQWHEPSL